MGLNKVVSNFNKKGTKASFIDNKIVVNCKIFSI